jgi:plasmid maintenance system antidote protein VapI
MKNIKKISKPKSLISEKEIWNEEDIDAVRNYIQIESPKQSPERLLRNELLAIKYQMLDYVNNDKISEEKNILHFVKLYLKALKINQKELASAFEMKDSNLHKYLKGERKLNTDIVFKLSAFSHTQPELWFYIQTKNELNRLRKEKDKMYQYEKYDYENIWVNEK